MAKNEGILHHFNQFKLLTPDAIKKCQNKNNEEKNGQTIFLDKYNLRDCSYVINIIKNLKTVNSIKIEENEKLHSNLNKFFEKNNLVEEIHNKKLAVFNLKLSKK